MATNYIDNGLPRMMANNGQRDEPASLFRPKNATRKDIAIAPVTTPSPSRLVETLR